MHAGAPYPRPQASGGYASAMSSGPAARRCIVILSDKSSGSSALQEYFVRYAGGRHVESTRHNKHETLYWTKSASLLLMPQEKMLDSEVPLAPERARADLIALLRDNLGGVPAASDERDLAFRGWRALCERFAPLFIEKSPHHLHQWSALELLTQCMDASPEIGFLAIGLVRNPIDVVYSSWRRWGSLPEENQHEWLRAARNLQRLVGALGPRLAVLRYEDMVGDPARLDFAHAFAGVPRSPQSRRFLHGESIQEWRRDPGFRFALAAPVRDLAIEFGYRYEELASGRSCSAGGLATRGKQA